MSLPDVPSWSLDFAKSIMEAVRLKDEETYTHCVRVGQLSRMLAQACGLNEKQQKTVEYSGLFHDVGKIGIPDAILLKPAQLTEDEYTLMKKHPEMSIQILQPLMKLDFYLSLKPGILHHHERYDGRGYPHALEGQSIPLESRMILIVDTFDAMTVTRAYRKGLSVQTAYQELKDFAGRQFDPELVKIFLDVHSRSVALEEGEIRNAA